MNVLSLFDGMSCGQIALHKIGIIPDIYYASEIDKYAIAQTQLNFPNTIQLGSVVDVDVSKLEHIDLLIGGSPCQSFSFAGKRKGMSTTSNEDIYTLERYLELKRDGFEFEGQSYLFWEYMRILTDIRKYNPDVKFLLENVEMGSKWERTLSEAIGVYGVHINSALVSAQNRRRIYWTNIRTRHEGLFGETHSDITQPENKGILLRDILQSDVDEKYYLSDKSIAKLNRSSVFNGCKSEFGKSNCITTRENAIRNDANYIKLDRALNPKQNQDKASCFTAGAHSGGNHSDMDLICVSMVGRKFDGKTNCLTSVHKDNLIMCLTDRQKNNLKSINEKANTFLSTSWKGSQANGMTLVNSNGINHTIQNQNRIRRLTPTECARLQTVPDWYKWKCSDTQQYKMLGNGWTVDVIAHIFKGLKNI